MNDQPGRQSRAFGVYHSAFIIFFAFCLIPASLSAQVVRLPAIEPPQEGQPGQLVSHPDSSAEILQTPGQTDTVAALTAAEESQLPPGVRNGVFQKVMFDATWLAPGGADGMGSNDLQVQSIFALPCPTIHSPLVITPGFAVHYLEGPQGVDLPARLHEGYTQFRWLSQVTPAVGLDLAVTPGIFSDFQQESDDAFRLTGHGATAWTWTDSAKIVLGAAYLDRPDAEVIPIGGLIWTPYEDVTFDLVFPHPKISHRVYWSGRQNAEVQDWVYIAGEFAGDAWAIRRADGTDDQVVLSDYRVILGMERKVAGGLSSRFEIGYVFGRRIRYTGGTAEFRPSDTIMLRGGLTY